MQPDPPATTLPSRRGVIHGLTAAGAVLTCGLGVSAAVADTSQADSAAQARRKHHHKHHHKHRHTPKPKPSQAQTPTTAPTTEPTDTPSAVESATPVASPSPSSQNTPSVNPGPTVEPALLRDPAQRNLATKFSFGVTPVLAAQVQAAGGALSWFSRQLDPSQIADDPADAVDSWWPSLDLGPTELWQRNQSGAEHGFDVMQSYQRWLLMRRILSDRCVHEVMTDFWENHLNVPVNGDGVFTWRAAYGKAIRQFALGRFDQLLTAAVTHPAMLIYLNGAVSTKAHPNENLGRELLELHTVGRGAYTEDDVKSSARILTGWRVDVNKTWLASYQPSDHYVGSVKVMDFVDANASSDGRDLTNRYLSFLANHPSTARQISTKLAIKFCQDAPSDGLIDSLSQIYLASGSDIKPVLLALVNSPEFTVASNSKVRTPSEDIVATYRALGVGVQAPSGTVSSAHVTDALLWQCDALGSEPHTWPQPNGAPIDSASWSSPSRMMASLREHWLMGGALWPKVGATYRTPVEWLPTPAVQLVDLIDYLSLQVLARPATADLITACCQAVGCAPATVITAGHLVVRRDFGRLLTTVLDSPTHMTR